MATIRTLDDLDGRPHADVFPGAEPKTVRLALDAGEGVAPHSHPDREVVLSLLEGRIEVDLDDETHELTAGDVARFDGDRAVAPRAVEESVALIVLASRLDE